MKKILMVVAVAGFFLAFGITTNAQDLQTRVLFHPTIDINEHWYLAGWAIGNAKLEAPGNINLLGGVGYRTSKWWMEGMVQRQWSTGGDQLLLDFRFQGQVSDRASLYVEVAPFLNKAAVLDFISLDYRVWRKVSLGAETENIHRPGLDSLGIGPRISYPVITKGKFKMLVALAYQMRRQERDPVRVYIAISRRFGK